MDQEVELDTIRAVYANGVSKLHLWREKKKENIRLTMRKMTEHTVTGKIATHHLHELYAADPDQPASMMIKQALSILILSQN